MTLVLNDDSLTAGIRLAFDQARADLLDARRDQRRKDTAAARARVAANAAYLDTLLDMWNDASSDRV